MPETPEAHAPEANTPESVGLPHRLARWFADLFRRNPGAGFAVMFAVFWLVPPWRAVWHLSPSLALADMVDGFQPSGLLIGGALFFGSWLGHRGDELHCRNCGFQLPPIGKQPERCSECGQDFSQPMTRLGGLYTDRALMKGKRIWRPGQCAIGGIIVLLCLPMCILPFSMHFYPVRLLPAQMQVNAFVYGGPRGPVRWYDLTDLMDRQPLTSRQRHQVFEVVLERATRTLERRGTIHPFDENWVDTIYGDGDITFEQHTAFRDLVKREARLEYEAFLERTGQSPASSSATGHQ